MLVYHKIASMLFKIKTKIDFLSFQSRIHKKTFIRHEEILNSAEKESHCLELEDEEIFKNSPDRTVRLGYELRKNVLQAFCNKHKNIEEIRILIHLPDKNKSPGKGFWGQTKST